MSREDSYKLSTWQQIRRISWRSWIVLLGCFYIAVTIDGYVFQYGLMKLEIEREYSNVAVDEVSVATIASLVPAEYCFFAPAVVSFLGAVSLRSIVIVGAIIQMAGFLLSFANEHLIHSFAIDMLALGFLQGLGASMQFVLSFIIIKKYFASNMGLASGIMTCGSPFGAIAFGLTYKYMVALPLGWTSVQLFFAGFAGVTIFFAIFFTDPDETRNRRPENNENNENPGDNETFSSLNQPAIETLAWYKQVWRSFKSQFTREIWTFDFLIVLIMTSFSQMGYYIPTLLITAQALDPYYNVTPIVCNNLIFIWGVFHLLGRIVAGQLADMSHKTRIFSTYWLYIIGLLVSAATLMAFAFLMQHGNVVFIMVVVIYGFFSASFFALQSKLCEEYYFETEEEKTRRFERNINQSPYDQAFAWLLFSSFFVFLIGFPLSTYLNTIQPLWAYTFAAGCFVTAAASLGLIYKGYFKALDRRNSTIRNRSSPTLLTSIKEDTTF